MTTNGAFGHYTIEGAKVTMNGKKSFHLHDTCGLTVFGNANRPLMAFFTVIVDEIREH